MIIEQLLFPVKFDPVPSEINPKLEVSVDPDSEQMESDDVLPLETEYEATNPDPVPDPSDTNETFMYPVDADTGAGKVEPL